MNLDIDGTIIRMTQETLKEENNACKDTCMSILIYQVTQGFQMTYRSHLLIRQTLKILLNDKISGFKPLKPKLHWNLTLKMVFRCNSLHFAPLIIFVDGLFLDNDFSTRFPYFIISIAVVVYLVLLFLVLPFCYYFIFLLIIFDIIIIIIIIIN